ncbi:MAG: hypothetical protein U0T83_01905 [Bacteriovoracaceae bacterium]
MKSLFYFILLLLIGLSQIEASELSFKGRNSILNCDTSEIQNTDFLIRYQNLEIPYGARIYLIYGTSNSVIPNRWLNNNTIEMKRVEPFTYSSLNSIKISNSDTFFKSTNINFIFRVETMDNKIFFDKGSDARLGFYQVTINNRKTCVSSDNEYPEFINWTVNKIIKN